MSELEQDQPNSISETVETVEAAEKVEKVEKVKISTPDESDSAKLKEIILSQYDAKINSRWPEVTRPIQNLIGKSLENSTYCKKYYESMEEIQQKLSSDFIIKIMVDAFKVKFDQVPEISDFTHLEYTYDYCKSFGLSVVDMHLMNLPKITEEERESIKKEYLKRIDLYFKAECYKKGWDFTGTKFRVAYSLYITVAVISFITNVIG